MTREDAISDAIHYARHKNRDSLIESCINDIFNYHEAQLKQAYINGSNSTNELVQSLYKQIEQLKDKQ